jgi:ABC-type phosphate transport system substrate-binding protein
MRAFRKFVVAGAVAATLVGIGGLGAGTAMADPLKTPLLTTLTGVGSDTITPLFDNGTKSQPKGDAPGTFVHDYNATKPKYPVASWNAVNPVTGIADQTISTKAKNSSDQSCNLERPDGSSAGIVALNENQTDTNKVAGQSKIYCIDYARSSRAPNTTTFEDAFVTLARDGLAWSFPRVTGQVNPQPRSLTTAELTAIYTCADRNWDQVGGRNAPIGAVLPQSGSGTRSSWLLDLGITATSEPCWENGTITVKGKTYVIEENTGLSTGNVAAFTTTQTIDGVKVPPADVIFPYSIGDWIAQGTKTKGVGGHASSIWGHGNLDLGETVNVAGTPEVAVTTNKLGQPVINPAWNPKFLRLLYGVTRNGCYVSSKPTSTAVCLPSSTPPKGGTAYPAYEVVGLKAFFGAKGWICTNKTAAADIVSYGFTRLSNCGALTAGD